MTELAYPADTDTLPEPADVAEAILDQLRTDGDRPLGALMFAMTAETVSWRSQSMAGHAHETTMALVALWAEERGLTEADMAAGGCPFDPTEICSVYSDHMSRRYSLLAA